MIGSIVPILFTLCRPTIYQSEDIQTVLYYIGCLTILGTDFFACLNLGFPFAVKLICFMVLAL